MFTITFNRWDGTTRVLGTGLTFEQAAGVVKNISVMLVTGESLLVLAE